MLATSQNSRTNNYTPSLQVRALAELELRRRVKLEAPQEKLSFEDWLSVVSPTFTWDWRHLAFVREQLDKITTGKLKRLMLFMPPRHGKSEMVTVRYPAWFLENSPSKRVIVGAYSQTLANKFSRKTRRIASARIPLNTERTAVEDWETISKNDATAQYGGLRAVGVGGGITGQGGDLIIIDDPVKNREEANSQTYRDKVYDWYVDDLSTRLEPGAAMILIMTRWHEDDLAGRILASDEGPNWTVINIPAIAELNDPLGREEGEALCPQRFDEAALLEIKQRMKTSFDALYQQRPSALEGEIFKREWWRFYRELPSLEKIIISWDTAFKKGAENDFSVGTIWGVAKNGYYLIDRWKERVEFPELKRAVINVAYEYPPDDMLIEDKASGQSLIQELQRETRLPIRAIKVDIDKVARANAVTPIIESGRVFLPENATWLRDYIDTLASFPNAAHDDDVDSTTQFLSYVKSASKAVFTMIGN